MRTIPRAAVAAVNVVMEQAKEDRILAALIAAAIGDGSHAPSQISIATDTVSKKQKVHVEQTSMQEPDLPSKRPPRAAAIAANAGISRQVQEEESFFGTLNTKKRSSASTAPTTKRSRLSTTKSKKVTQDTRTIAGKKRRQAAAYEAVPVITDLPPLPFCTTTNSEFQVKKEEPSTNKQKTTVNKQNTTVYKRKTKVETKKNHSLQKIEGQGGRRCEFCRKEANICVLMHCTACRRVYHAKCLVHIFKPYVDENTPILDQIGRLRFENRGNIFRCASCKAAFVDFYESGGYLWDCDCPTCSQPEKLALYRQRKLLQMINGVELKKQQKQEQKNQVNNATKNDAGKPPVPMGSRSNSASRSRTTPGEPILDARATRLSTLRSSSASPHNNELMTGAATTKTIDVASTEFELEVAAVENMTTAEPVDAIGGGDLDGGETTARDQQIDIVNEQRNSLRQENDEPCQQNMGESKPELEVNNKNTKLEHSEPKNVSFFEPKKLTERDTIVVQQHEQPNSETLTHPDAPVDQPTASQKQKESAPKVIHELIGEPEQPMLSGDELVSAVRVHHDDKTNHWHFPIMCSRTSSLHESGVMKSGSCMWSPKKMTLIQCKCCDKQFNYAEFVHHTDSRLVKNPKNASEDPMPYLFVEHRDITQHTPLEKFLPALRGSLNNTPTKLRRNHSMRPEVLTSAIIIPTTVMTNPEATTKALLEALSRLRTLALFKRPKHRSDKTSAAARLSDSVNLDFLAQVVCLSPKYVMRMVNGSLVDRAAYSEIPVPGHSFPRKSGWLAFNRSPFIARHATCMCCEKSFSFDDFAEHAGIVLTELKQRPRQLVYVVERQDDSVLTPFNTFAPDLDTAAKANALDLLLDELNFPPACPRPN